MRFVLAREEKEICVMRCLRNGYWRQLSMVFNRENTSVAFIGFYVFLIRIIIWSSNMRRKGGL